MNTCLLRPRWTPCYHSYLDKTKPRSVGLAVKATSGMVVQYLMLVTYLLPSLKNSSVLTVFVTIIHYGCHLQHCSSADYALPISAPCRAGRWTPASTQPFATRHQSPFSATPNLLEYLDIAVLLRASHFQNNITCIILYSAWITGTREEQDQALFIILVSLSVKAKRSN